MTEPTDAELDAIWHNSNPTNFEARSFARAVLAKWGTPAVAVDPDNAFPLASKIYKRGEEWVLEVSGTINDCHFTCRHTQPGNLQPEDVAGLPTLYTTPQPTQAQAGAVPLPKFLALKFHARRDKKATVTLLFQDHEAADAWVRGIRQKGADHA